MNTSAIINVYNNRLIINVHKPNLFIFDMYMIFNPKREGENSMRNNSYI